VPAPEQPEESIPEPSAPPALEEAEEPIPEPAPPIPPAPSRTVSTEPAGAPTAARAAPSARTVALGLAGIAVLLGVILLFRGGIPWTAGTPEAGPAEGTRASLQPTETPASAEPGETIPVNVNATPWASIEVDGEYLGVTPLADVPLSPGPHVFRARLPDGEIREHRIEVSPTMRHVVFYAEPTEQVEPAPEAPAGPAPPPLLTEAPPEAPTEATPRLERPPTEAATAPDRVAAVAEPEPAFPPPIPAVPEPEIESPVPATSVIEPPEIAVEPSPAQAEPSPEVVVEVPAPSRDEAPEVVPPPEQLAAVREPEPVPEPTPEPAPPPTELISISINATPWATIEIDGEEVGITPMAGVLLAPGDHQFRVIMPDGTVLEPVVRIAPDNRHIAFP
jgi:hypothetical protein